ncbi:MAG: protein kinase, partial [Myxococcales bacterium]|nr:protein kinase [Myxococcales bacterium]
DREVAVKLILGNDSAVARTRLYREAQALAKLAHPNVVAVHDVGTHRGQVWVSMEFVVGRTFGAWVKEERPGWRQVLSVIKQAGRGIAAAHAEGLLHRDIKPDNVMVGDDGRVRVMDFGLARADVERERELDHEERRSALSVDLTAAGTIMGTPAYMAPEQFLGLSADVRTDEFSLAATLWEALYGQRPFVGDTFKVLSVAVTAGRRAPAPADNNVPTWLRRVLDRALEVDPNKRFESVRVMLEAIETREQRGRLRAVVAGLAIAALILAGLGVTAAYQWRAAAESEVRAERERDRALLAQKRAEAAQQAAEDARVEAQAERDRATRALASEKDARENAKAAKERAESERQAAEESERRAKNSEKATKSALEGQRRATKKAEEQQRRAEQNLARAESESRRARDASRLAAATRVVNEDPTIALALLREVEDPVNTRGWISATVEALQRPASAAVFREHSGYVVAAGFSPDGEVLATASRDGSARLFPVADGTSSRVLPHGDAVTDIACSPDGERVATASADGIARLWRLDGSAEVLGHHGSSIEEIVFSPTGEAVATASRDGSAVVWDVRGRAAPTRLEGHSAAVRSVAFSSSGARLVTTSDDGTARVWALASTAPDQPLVLNGHRGTVYDGSFSPDGALVVTAGDDRTARVWRVERVDL